MAKDFSDYFLITDLDGTLLTSDKKIRPEDIESINSFVNAGGSFSVATGRVFDSAMQYIKLLPVNMPCILYNGGMIYDTTKNNVVWQSVLPPEAKYYTKKILSDHPFLGAEIIVGKDIFIPQTNNILNQKLSMEHVNGVSCNINDIKENWIKVVFTHESCDTEKLKAYTNSRMFQNVSFVESFDCYYEMLPVNISKGTALNRLRNEPALNNKKIVAVGDYNNDIDMIKEADIGACVINSKGEVKRAADLVLTKTSDEGAISELINTLLN